MVVVLQTRATAKLPDNRRGVTADQLASPAGIASEGARAAEQQSASCRPRLAGISHDFAQARPRPRLCSCQIQLTGQGAGSSALLRRRSSEVVVTAHAYPDREHRATENDNWPMLALTQLSNYLTI